MKNENNPDSKSAIVTPLRLVDNSPEEDAFELYRFRILQTLRKIIRAVDLYSKKLSMEWKITVPQLICLHALEKQSPQTPSSLSKQIHLSLSTIAGILDRLEEKRLVKRRKNTTDRRQVEVQLTPRGRKLIQKTPSPLQDRLSEALQALPELEQATLALSLEKIVDLMEAGSLDAAPILETGTALRGAVPAGSNPTSEKPSLLEFQQQIPLRDANRIVFRKPKVSDGSRIWNLIKSCPPLDLNSSYAYLLLSEHFGDFCVVAEFEKEMIGFVSAYPHPKKSDTLFVWQVALAQEYRGRGVAQQMLHEILKREEIKNTKFLEVTIIPTNRSSRNLFNRITKSLGTHCEESPCFSAQDFPGESHEEEILFRIGPFSLPIFPRS